MVSVSENMCKERMRTYSKIGALGMLLIIALLGFLLQAVYGGFGSVNKSITEVHNVASETKGEVKTIMKVIGIDKSASIEFDNAIAKENTTCEITRKE